MGRLLDEDDVIDALEKVASFFPYRIPGKGETYDKYNEAWNDAIGRAEMEIEQLPSAQPEREKGEWIWCGDKHVCSECDEFALCDAYDVLETGEYQEDLSDFCPHCGADMRGEQE